MRAASSGAWISYTATLLSTHTAIHTHAHTRTRTHVLVLVCVVNLRYTPFASPDCKKNVRWLLKIYVTRHNDYRCQVLMREYYTATLVHTFNHTQKQTTKRVGISRYYPRRGRVSGRGLISRFTGDIQVNKSRWAPHYKGRPVCFHPPPSPMRQDVAVEQHTATGKVSRNTHTHTHTHT